MKKVRGVENLKIGEHYISIHLFMETAYNVRIVSINRRTGIVRWRVFGGYYLDYQGKIEKSLSDRITKNHLTDHGIVPYEDGKFHENNFLVKGMMFSGKDYKKILKG